MKLGILTQPLGANYGGILQAYALHTILKKMGHEVFIINNTSKKVSLINKTLSIFKRILLKIVLNRRIVIRSWPTGDELKIINGNFDKFIQEHMQLTKRGISFKNLQNEYNFEGYIVGSDQVWRPSYTTDISVYFLSFLKDKIKIKKISYAASFGVDNWEFSNKQTKICSALIKKFTAVSVREASGVGLCQNYLGLTPTLVLDPTMLLRKEDYTDLIKSNKIYTKRGNLFCYFLDDGYKKEKELNHFIGKLGFVSFSILPSKQFSEVSKKGIEQCIYPPIANWIKAFDEAEFIVTDSFHGTVFSIIFNKPFITISNNDRGKARFTSLLTLFGLESRLITTFDNLNADLFKSEIDYTSVNLILQKERDKSYNFLYEALPNGE